MYINTTKYTMLWQEYAAVIIKLSGNLFIRYIFKYVCGPIKMVHIKEKNLSLIHRAGYGTAGSARGA